MLEGILPNYNDPLHLTVVPIEYILPSRTLGDYHDTAPIGLTTNWTSSGLRVIKETCHCLELPPSSRRYASFEISFYYMEDSSLRFV